ncbi:tripartite tricarboxylate transporter substrate binding protein [Achromobacter sp. UMC71]|uniref:Bug family tripartite tricarboxylate transporter substrate binding protein n=1 Tax=Achromobacter sp. UMC71 TaxID=1862320 RepID=UPI0021060EE6|nr:tripartite tricarboxylate transporter substrate binding protein [Achromobacter sp. UMC71]
MTTGPTHEMAVPARARQYNTISGWASVLSLCMACLFPGNVLAQDAYPSKPIRLLVGASAGGGSDLLARILAERWSQSVGQPVIVENRPGAANTLAGAAVAKAPADGYTLLLATNTGQSIAPAMIKLPFDPNKDLQPIGMVIEVPQLLIVGPKEKARGMAELISEIKARPQAFNYASSGVGSTQHLAGAVLAIAADLKMSHVPYKGSSAAYPDLISGQVQLMIDTSSSAIAHIRTGKLRALAITTPTRSQQFPDVPTMREAGYPEVDITTWYGLYAPTGTPKPILDSLYRELQKALGDPATRERLRSMGGEIPSLSRQQFVELNRAEADRYGKLVRALGVKAD